MIRGGTVNDQQAGFEVLGTLKSGEAEKALSSFFDELAAGKMAPAVQLDLVDAMQANGAPALEANSTRIGRSKAVDTVTLAFRDALLQGAAWRAAANRSSRIPRPSAPAATRCAMPARMSARTSPASRPA